MLDASAVVFTSVRDERLEWLDRGLNAQTSVIVVGQKGDQGAPGVGIIRCAAGPGDRLRGRHTHTADAINLVIEGAMYMDGAWLRPGQAKVVPAGFEYGDAMVGPEGVTFLEIFADLPGIAPHFADSQDQDYFELVHGGELRGHVDGLIRTDAIDH